TVRSDRYRTYITQRRDIQWQGRTAIALHSRPTTEASRGETQWAGHPSGPSPCRRSVYRPQARSLAYHSLVCLVVKLSKPLSNAKYGTCFPIAAPAGHHVG